MDKRIKKCKWIEEIIEYPNVRFLCHFEVDSKKVNIEKDCNKCKHFEVCKKE